MLELWKDPEKGAFATDMLWAPSEGKMWCQVLVTVCPQVVPTGRWRSLSMPSFGWVLVS